MNQTAEIINQENIHHESASILTFKRPYVKADVNEGFDRVAGKLTDILNKPPVSLPERERQIIGVVIAKTYRYHKKWDWISREQFSEDTGIADLSNITKIINSLKAKRVLIEDGKKIAINTTISEWRDAKKVTSNPKKVTSDPTQKSHQQPAEKLPATLEKLPATRGGVASDTHNRKTILQKTIITIDKPAKRNTQIPDDFCITGKMRAWSTSKNFTINIDEETENFVLYWKGAGKTKADWTATWQVWMNKNNKDSAPKQFYKNKSQPENFASKDYGQSTFTGDQ